MLCTYSMSGTEKSKNLRPLSCLGKHHVRGMCVQCMDPRRSGQLRLVLMMGQGFMEETNLVLGFEG